MCVCVVKGFKGRISWFKITFYLLLLKVLLPCRVLECKDGFTIDVCTFLYVMSLYSNNVTIQ